jgi:molecular chaperone GrpE
MSETQKPAQKNDTQPLELQEDSPAHEVIDDPIARVAELELKNVELADAYLRAKADAENTRRRAEDEIAKSR